MGVFWSFISEKKHIIVAYSPLRDFRIQTISKLMIKNFRKFFFVFLCYMFLFASNIEASDWTKHPNNPVLAPSNTGWDSQHVASPAVIYENNQFKMWYQGIGNSNLWNIGLATSNDGINWQKNENNPLLTPKNENNVVETGIVEPTVVKTDIYRMWYNSQNNDVYKIRLATSSDGIHWQNYPGYVLVGQAAWEAKGVANPSVIFREGKFIMAYTGWGYSSGWRVGLAESTDGIYWTKSSGNPLNLPSLGHISGQSIYFFNNQYHLFYHTGGALPTDIYYVVSNDLINWQCLGSCVVTHSDGSGFDGVMSVSPEPLFINNGIYLWYGGYRTNWQIGLTTNGLSNQFSIALVILPGLFASWNKQALIYNQPVNNSDWQLNPFVREYDGLKQTLINLGLQENRDFYIFPYDWRKNLNSLADDLNSYLNQLATSNQSPATNFNLIGHSLGGLVARIYAQKYGTEKINKLITVGSPHQGVAQIYKTVEAGELDKYDDYFWLSQKLLLQLYKDGLKSDKQIVNEKIPIVKDLLPTYNFLKNQNNQEISIQDMSIKNDTLLSYNSNLTNLPNLFQTLVGEKGNTLAGYKVGPRTTIDQLLDNYPDGRPIENFYQIGDYTVLSSCAQAGNNNKIFNLDHGEIIYKKEPIKEILNSFSIPYQENQIIEGAATKINPSLLFLILSPAQMEVTYYNNTYIEKDGLIFIENAQSGDYQLNITGKQKGDYQILIGQVGNDNDQWSSVYGTISADPSTSQSDEYLISFDQHSPLEFPLYQNDPLQYFDLSINRLIGIDSRLHISHLKTAIKRLIEARANYLKKDFSQLKFNLEHAQQNLFQARKKLDSETKYEILNLIDQLEFLYSLTLESSDFPVDSNKLFNEFNRNKKTISSLENHLLRQKEIGKNITEKALLLIKAKNKLLKAEENYSQNKFFYFQILIETTNELIKEIR